MERSNPTAAPKLRSLTSAEAARARQLSLAVVVYIRRCRCDEVHGAWMYGAHPAVPIRTLSQRQLHRRSYLPPKKVECTHTRLCRFELIMEFESVQSAMPGRYCRAATEGATTANDNIDT